MKRRGFLALLGLAPLLAKGAAAEKTEPPPKPVRAEDTKCWVKMEASYGTFKTDERIEAGSFVSLVGRDKVEPSRQGQIPIGIAKASTDTGEEAIVVLSWLPKGNVR